MLLHKTRDTGFVDGHMSCGFYISYGLHVKYHISPRACGFHFPTSRAPPLLHPVADQRTVTPSLTHEMAFICHFPFVEDHVPVESHPH